MIPTRSAIVVTALIGLFGVGALPSHAEELSTGGTQLQTDVAAKPQTPAKPKVARKHAPKQEASKPSPADQYSAPLELNFDPMKRVILKAEPSVPYQPLVTSKLPPTTKTGDDRGQAHLAPLMRETSIPESFGDKGSFLDRHEFGIQLHDHF